MSVRLQARPTNRSLHVVSVFAIVLAIVVAALLVANATYSAFSATTSNGPSTWTTGTIDLADDDAGAASFTVANLAPGSTGEKCIAVTSDGTLNKSVKLYGVGHSTTQALSDHIALTITQGTGGTFAGGCAGFTADASGGIVFAASTLSAFAGSHTSFADGAGTWNPAGGAAAATKVYRFAYSVDSGAPSSVQGGSSAITFRWEAQSV